MRRGLLWIVIALVGAVLCLVLLVVLRGAGADELPPPDMALPIDLADGTRVPLAELLERARQHPRAEPADGGPRSEVQPLRPTGDERPDFAPVFDLARHAANEGRPEQALALYLSIPPGDPHYARARRLVAWNLLARDLHQPARGVRYVNDAFLADPFEPKVWEDLWRVYTRTLGLPLG